ncbi:polyprenyl synthetase family protein [Atopobacter phocae]|uniref:polyprenyl synthetase family protein n=1 Tax=Atopobacter phocae TaxID=136492 RepID=UPI00046F58B1|nr:polyprenyl synthetase family protein [Atopobacter phocae]
MFIFWHQHRHIKDQLTAVQQLIESILVVPNEELQQAFTDLLNAGGKMLRPALILIFAELFKNPTHSIPAEKNSNQLIGVAASIELLHMASLIHDDIIDDSPLRRGQKTVQSRYGKDVAVYAGDYLFTSFFDLLINHMQGTPYLKRNSQVMKQLLIGEINQLNHRYKLNATIDEYLNTIEGKTAALFALSCEEGAYFSGASPDMIAIANEIGRLIGLTFQICDDILDYVGDESTLKKPILEDVNQGIYSLPLLLALNTHRQELTPYLNKTTDLTTQNAQQIAAIVKSSNSVDRAREMAWSYSNEAIQLIQQLPKHSFKNELIHLIQQLVERTY